MERKIQRRDCAEGPGMGIGALLVEREERGFAWSGVFNGAKPISTHSALHSIPKGRDPKRWFL